MSVGLPPSPPGPGWKAGEGWGRGVAREVFFFFFYFFKTCSLLLLGLFSCSPILSQKEIDWDGENLG